MSNSVYIQNQNYSQRHIFIKRLVGIHCSNNQACDFDYEY